MNDNETIIRSYLDAVGRKDLAIVGSLLPVREPDPDIPRLGVPPIQVSRGGGHQRTVSACSGSCQWPRRRARCARTHGPTNPRVFQ
jgi:hypothetical protein